MKVILGIEEKSSKHMHYCLTKTMKNLDDSQIMYATKLLTGFFLVFFLIAFILGIQTRHSRSSVRSHFNYNYTIHFVGRTVQIRNSLDRLMVKTISDDMCKWYEMI